MVVAQELDLERVVDRPDVNLQVELVRGPDRGLGDDLDLTKDRRDL